VYGELELFKVPLNDLILRTISQSDQELGVCNLRAVEGKRDEFAAFYFVGGERFLLAGEEVNKEDERHLIGLLAPGKETFVLTLSNGSNALGAGKSVDEVLYLLVFEGSAEIIKNEGIGGRKDEFVLLGVGGVKEERVLDLPVVVRDVLLYNGVPERRSSLLHFQTVIHFVTYTL
jgi:hypothetical protein